MIFWISGHKLQSVAWANAFNYPVPALRQVKTTLLSSSAPRY